MCIKYYRYDVEILDNIKQCRFMTLTWTCLYHNLIFYGMHLLGVMTRWLWGVFPGRLLRKKNNLIYKYIVTIYQGYSFIYRMYNEALFSCLN